jgi:dihydroxyacetone kinase
MTYLYDQPNDFAADAVAGFAAAHPTITQVHGGVVRASATPPGQPALVIGGGTGHYPAFSGWVGPGMAHGSPCGNVFASPSASQVYSVARNAENGGGVVLGFGNYAGDMLHFGLAAEKLRAEGIDVRVVPVSDDVASNDQENRRDRRGIAGDLPVLKAVGAAIENGADLDEAERIATKANEATRSLGVAFDGCTLPGADEPLFRVPEGKLAVGLGIHGEPGCARRADGHGGRRRGPPGRRRPAGRTGANDRRVRRPGRRDPQRARNGEVRGTIRGLQPRRPAARGARHRPRPP